MTAQWLSRRLITLIFAGRNRMDMIRRELPRTERAGWGRSPFRIERKEGSPFRGPCAVIGFAVQENIWLLFYAAIASLCFCSVFNAIAHMKPSSSRPSAVTIWFLFLPRAANVLYRLCNRCCAFHAICFTSSLNDSDFCLLSRNPVTLGRC